MNIIKSIYEFYKKYLPDILLLIVVFFLVFLAKNVPYINLLILNVDPLLSGIIIAWIIYYLIKTPNQTRIIKIALMIFVSSYFFVLTHNDKIAELLASLSFSMIFTSIIVELIRLKKELKKEKR